MVRISFPDGGVREFEAPVTGLKIAEGISQKLAKEALSITVDGVVWDLTRPIDHDATVKINTWDDAEGKHAYWHSSAHLMAEAVEDLFPGVRLGIGPSIENGFYYDIDFGDYKVTDDDLARIEERMRYFAKQKEPIVRRDISKQEALDEYQKKGDPYKLELIEGLEDGTISFYSQGKFTDLCRGPHVPDTGYIKAIKLLSLAGAYWRGDEHNKQLTRIYGITFPKESLLTEYLAMLEEAKKRDHRKIGKELGLFTFSQRVGQGLPLWLPRGAQLRERLENFLREVQKEYGYLPVITPHIGQKALYETSGHWAKYGADSFRPIETPQEGEIFLLKPMNCPHHCEIYRSSPRSYRDLPLRLAEFGTVYRYEQSGELHGLTRVRGFTQDDAHIFCRPEQVKSEFLNVMDIIQTVFRVFQFDNFEAQISLRDPKNTEKYIGSDEVWAESEQAIIEACREKGLEAKIEYGEAAFYGPKLDFMVKDAIGRRWQLGTIQVDYNLPERFKLEYTAENNTKHTPVMIHRAPFGSLERFTAVLIEHTAGHFPLWLTPDQVAILPISEKFNDYAQRVAKYLDSEGVRATLDTRNEKIGRKIRDNELKRIPYMVIVGEQEEAEGLVSMRQQGGGEQASMSMQAFARRVNDEVAAQLS